MAMSYETGVAVGNTTTATAEDGTANDKAAAGHHVKRCSHCNATTHTRVTSSLCPHHAEYKKQRETKKQKTQAAVGLHEIDLVKLDGRRTMVSSTVGQMHELRRQWMMFVLFVFTVVGV